MAIVKECELCGDEFEARRKYSRFCYKKHMRDCIVCEEEFEVVVPSRPAVMCSQKCVGKYSKNPSVYTNIYKDNRRIYVKKCEICHNEFQTHNKKKRYCDNRHERNCEICGDKFTMTSQAQIYCTKQHYKECEICEERFKVKQNHRPGKVCSFSCGARLTNSRFNQDPINYRDWANFKEFTMKTNYDCFQLSEYFDMTLNSIRSKAHKENATGYIKDFYSYSNPELEVKHMLISLGFKEGIDFIPNVRSVISPYELDFYLPEYSLAIEVSPTHTHNAKYGWAKKSKGLNKSYHYDKFNMCQEKGIELITKFDWMKISDVKHIVKTICKLYKEDNEYKINIKNTDESKFVILDKTEKEIASISLEIDEEDKVVKLSLLEINERHCIYKVTSVIVSNLIREHKGCSIEVEVDLSTGIRKIYDELKFNSKEISSPKLHYHHSIKDIYVSYKDANSDNVKNIEANGLLPIYDCGYELLIFKE